MKKTVYLFDEETGKFVCAYDAPISPEEKGGFLIPINSTEVEPPAEVQDKTRHFVGGEWVYESVPVKPEPGEEPTPGQKRHAEIIDELADIDSDSVRPARAISIAIATGLEPDATDVDMLVLLESRAAALRIELAELFQ